LLAPLRQLFWHHFAVPAQWLCLAVVGAYGV